LNEVFCGVIFGSVATPVVRTSISLFKRCSEEEHGWNPYATPSSYTTVNPSDYCVVPADTNDYVIVEGTAGSSKRRAESPLDADHAKKGKGVAA
jgi:hypothetical protein